jgi:hypothetical protein
MACTACRVVKVSYVSGRHKKALEKQALVVGTKQSRQANKAVGPACFVLFPLLAHVLPSGFFTNLCSLSNLLFLDIYGYCTFLRYLWILYFS